MKSKIDDKADGKERWRTVSNISLGYRYDKLEIEFNPEYQP